MNSNRVSRSSVRNFLATVVVVAAAILIIVGENGVVEADEFPPFFLKAAKSVPRIGRRSGTFEDFFLKASKSVPRIGRRGGYEPASVKTSKSFPWYAKHAAELSRVEGDDLRPYDDYLREIEQYPELWEMAKAAEGGSDAPTAAGYANGVWQREKRTGSETATV